MIDMLLGSSGMTEAEVEAIVEAAMSNLKRVETFSGVTDGSGNVSFVYSPAFTTVEHIGVHLVGVSDITTGHRITADTLSGCTVKIERPAAISVALIGLTVLTSTMQNVASQTIKLVVVGT